MKIIIKLMLTLGATILVTETGISPAATQEADLYSLCNKFPLNSRCQNNDYVPKEPKLKTDKYEIDRDTFCQKFSFNSRCQQKPTEVIKLNLDRSGEDDEWILIQKNGDTVRLLHQTKVKNALVSGILNGALGFSPVPLPFVEANKYSWKNHQVTKVTFQSDNCQADSCKVTQTQALQLPEKTNIYQGLFTIQYRENNLMRSLSFRIPADLKATTVDTITISR
jgi:hypothetical protein